MAKHDVRTGPDGGSEWMAFPGGELEGEAISSRCPACTDALNRRSAATDAHPRLPGLDVSPDAPARARTLCFQCYRTQLERNRALRAAAELHTASEARFASQLPFETVDGPRLQMLKAQRLQTRDTGDATETVTRRRRAQIAARHALRMTTATLNQERERGDRQARDRKLAFAIRAAELQLPESWLPFVIAH